MSMKSLVDQVYNMQELDPIISMILADLIGRILGFYKKSGRVPRTLSIGYWDHKSKERKSKSGPINLNIKEDRFFEVLKQRTNDLLKVISGVIFPCIFITVTMRNFEKIKKYGADLGSFTVANKDNNKDKSKQPALNFFKRPPVATVQALETEVPSVIQEKENSNNTHLNMDNSNHYKDVETSIGYNNQSNSNTVFFRDHSNGYFMEEENTILTQKIEQEDDEEEIEKTKCEKCGEMVPEKDLVDHHDFHIAQDLDKELNPNKRKYRQVDDEHVIVNVEGKEYKEKKDQDIVAQPKKMVENKKNLTGVEFKGIKKSQTEQVKEQPKKKIVQMKSLDSFFSKK